MGFAAGNLSPAFQQACTLKPMDGSKRSVLPGGVNGKMTWSACTNIVHDFVFEWPRKQIEGRRINWCPPSVGTEKCCVIAPGMEKGHEDGVEPIRRSGGSP
jgi:hypothetical protein